MRNFVVTIDGKTYSVGVEEVGESANTNASAPVNALVAQTAPKANLANGEKVIAPFNGLIKNILVDDGAAVKKDQPIIVLEAMKMDNDITAPCDGKVTLSVSKGANVETNALLAVIS